MYGFTTYSLQGRPCTVYGKLDTPAFNVNLTNLYKLFLETIDHAEQENRRNGYDDLYGYTNIDRRTGKPHPFFYTRSQSRGRSRSRALTDEEFKAEVAKHFFGGDESFFDIVVDRDADIFPPKNARRIKPNDIQNMQLTTFMCNIRKCINLNGTLNGQTIQYPVISHSLTSWKAIFNSIPQYQNINFENIDFEFTDDIDIDLISDENAETLLGIEFKNSNGDKLTINFESDMATGKLRVNYSVEKHPESRSEGGTSSGVQVQLGSDANIIMNNVSIIGAPGTPPTPILSNQGKKIIEKMIPDENGNTQKIEYEDSIKTEISNFIQAIDILSSFTRLDGGVSILIGMLTSQNLTIIQDIQNGQIDLKTAVDQLETLAQKLKQDIEENQTGVCSIVLSIS